MRRNERARALSALRTAIGWVGAAALAAAASTPAAASDRRERAVEVLARADLGRSDTSLAADLTRLGPEAIPDLYDLVLGAGQGRDVAPPLGDFDRCRRVALIALARLPGESVAAHVERRIDRRAPLSTNIAALLVLAEVSAPRGVAIVASVAEGLAPAQLESPPVRAHVTRAFTSSLRAGRQAWRDLERRLDRLPDALLPLLVEAARDADAGGALDLYAHLRGRSVEVDEGIAEAVARLFVENFWTLPRDPAPLVRPLLQHEDERVRRAAAVAIVRIHDIDSLEALVRLLSDDDAGVRKTALLGLQQLTGARIGPDPDAWHEWADLAYSRWTREGPLLREDLGSGEPARIVEALHILGEERLHQREAARAIATVLGHEFDDLALAACVSLQRLGCGLAVPDLVGAMRDPDARVRRGAWQALCAITGRSLPPEASAWEKLLGR